MSIEKVNIFIGQCYSISVCLLESDWLVGWRLFLYGDWLFSLVVDFQLCSILVDLMLVDSGWLSVSWTMCCFPPMGQAPLRTGPTSSLGEEM